MDLQQIAQLIESNKKAAAASLAGGIIASSGKRYSMEEAIKVFNDAYFSLFPSVGHGRYDMWNHSFDPKKVYE
jgi:hypothetical protein